MKKIWLITLTMTLATLPVAADRAEAQVAPVAPGPGAPGAPRPADVSARPNQKEKHHTDAEFFQQATAGGRKEVASATFAALTASSPDVKALANRLVKDHTAGNQELERMAGANKYAFKEATPSTKSESWRTETG